MGILDIFRRKEEPKKGAISIEQAEVILSKKVDVSEFSPTFSQIRKAREDALSTVDSLRNAKFEEDIDRRLQNVIDGARHAFLEKVSAAVADIKTSGSNLDEVNYAYKSIIKAIEVSNDAINRYATKVSMGFDKHLKGFSASFSRFNSILERMKEKLDAKNEEELSRLKKLEIIQDYKRVGGIVDELSSDVNELDNRVRVAESKLAEIESGLKQVESSKRNIKLNSIKADIKLLEDKRSELKQGLHAFRNEMEKGLRAYRSAVEGTGAATLIDNFISEPEGILRDAESCSRMALIIDDVIKQIEAGGISLKQKRREKALKAAKAVKLEAICKAFIHLSDEIEKKRLELESSGLLEQRMGLTKGKDEVSERLVDLRNRRLEIEVTLSEKKKELNRLKMQIHGIISEI